MDELDKPASKRELKETETSLRGELNQTERALREEIAASELRLRTEMKEQTKGIIEHFNFVAEQIRADISGANKDEISSLANKIEDHETRIQSLEKTH